MTTTTPRPAVWTWALWFSLMACLGQAALVAAASTVLHRLITLSRDFIWMALLADLVIFAAAALVLDVGGRRLRPQSQTWIALSCFVFLAILGPFSQVPRLDRFAKLILMAGIAIQGGRLLRTHLTVFNGLIRRTLWGLAAVTLTWGIGLHFWRDLASRASAGVTAPADSPNVILIVMDTVRAKGLGLYGYERATSPRLERFSKTGVTFDRALSNSPWTLPSHGSLFTGRLPHEISADWLTPLDDTYPTLATAFNERGYQTAAFVANLLYCTSASGLDRGFARFEDFPISWRMSIHSSWLARALLGVRELDGETDRFVRKRASDVNAGFLDWLADRPRRPFFAFLNYFDTHAPYLPPQPFDSMFGDGSALPDPAVRRSWSAAQIQRSVDAYDGAMAYLDSEIGKLIDELDSRGLLENTLIVITSDHGEQFGEHGLFDHANSLYRQVLQVPLVVSFRGHVPAGVRVPHPVALSDLAATIVDLSDLAAVGRPDFPGSSLAQYWRQTNTASRPATAIVAEVTKGINTPPWLPVSKGSMQSIVRQEAHYIRHSDGREELFDFERDPEEVEDLAGNPNARESLQQSRRALDAKLRTGPTF